MGFVIQDVAAPTVGRIVHYRSRGSADGCIPPEARAAVVSEVSGESSHLVGLVVLNPSGLFFHSLADGGVPFSADGVPGTWSWPPRA